MCGGGWMGHYAKLLQAVTSCAAPLAGRHGRCHHACWLVECSVSQLMLHEQV